MINLGWTAYCKFNMVGCGASWVLTYFSTFVPEFKNDKMPNSLCLVGKGGVVNLHSNFCP